MRLPLRVLPSLLAASSSFASSASSAARGGPPPREPARQRQDNAPLYEQIRRERSGAADRLALEKRRADLRRAQFDVGGGDGDDGAARRRLVVAQHRAPDLPANCLRWRDYALFAQPPQLQPLKSLDEEEEQGGASFASMLRRSSFVALGDFENRLVVGRVFERHEDSLYVDFGGKFHAVCPLPRVNSEKYVRGAQVTLRLIDPEMTSRFIGSERHVTLLEADAVLLGLLQPADGSVEAAAEADGDGGGEGHGEAQLEGADRDTASPLSQRTLQLALDEIAAAAVASAYAGSGESGVDGFNDFDGLGKPVTR